MLTVKRLKLEKERRGVTLILDTEEGPIAYKLSVSVSHQLMQSLFRVITPGWGGEREGAGKRKD